MAVVSNVLIRTLITYGVTLVMSVLFLVIILPLTFLPASVRYSNRFFYWLTSRWSSWSLSLAGLSIAISGEEKVPQDPAIFVMNHGSALDILLVEKCLKDAPRLWLSKDEYRKTPILNWLLHRMHVMVDALSPTQAAGALKMLHKKAGKHKMHVLIFPEGARFHDGKIHRFFKGFSLLSSVLSQPVVPIYLSNVYKVYPKNSILLRNERALKIIVGDSMVRRVGESHDQFTLRVHDWFVATQKLLSSEA